MKDRVLTSKEKRHQRIILGLISLGFVAFIWIANSLGLMPDIIKTIINNPVIL